MSVDINYGFLEVLSVFSRSFLFLFVLPLLPPSPLGVGYISQMSEGSLLSNHINCEVLELIGSSVCLRMACQFLSFTAEWLYG